MNTQKAREVLEIFKETGQIDFSKLSSKCNLTQHDFNIMSIVFLGELEMTGWKLIILEEAKQLIAESLKDFQTNHNEAFLRMTARLAVVSTNNYHPSELNSKDSIEIIESFKEIHPKLEKMWLEAFKNESKFAEFFIEIKNKYGRK